MSVLRNDSKLALFYFLLIALLGVILRLFQLVDVPANYRYLVHAHSHVALLGWVYIALTTLIYKLYLNKAAIRKKYRAIFWFTQLTIIGMLVTFPFTGYAILSIIFSTLFLFASYVFTWLFIKYTPNNQKETYSYRCIRISLIYMILSSIGPWALGIIMNTLGSDSEWYRNAIYFYLHFQYNGWFIMALFGILFYIFEQKKLEISKAVFNRFFLFFNIGILTTFCISLLWMKPHSFLYLISGLGALLQLIGIGILLKELFRFKNELVSKESKNFVLLLRVAVLVFLIKLILQLVGTIPYFATKIASNIDVVIGYIHWIFLGVVSITTLSFLAYFRLIRLTKITTLIYLIGFALTEGLIFYKGIVIWLRLPLIDHYQVYLVIASCILLVAILSIFSIQFKRIKV